MLRRVGKAAGRLTAADSQDAIRPFEVSVEQVPDLAIVRYEYANSLLYTYQGDQAQQALAQLMLAAQLPARFSMEWLDRAYARKRLKKSRPQASGMSFKRFDRKRRKFMEGGSQPLRSESAPFW